MPRWDVDDAWDDPEDPDEDDLDDEDDLTIPCPHCRRPVPEDVARCPYCEHYLSREDAPPQPKPWWIIAGVVVCLYIVYRWNFG